ncbi:PE family protein [Mycobacterium tuberculosis variant bovis]|uniref:Pe family protein pe14 n=2 Tax=Mycobacterium tuberculosis TaxID=1773 RepID=A0A1R3XXP3_MYCBO|nr:PE family protein [Mycobacterium tuberculosis variant bovis 04-303]KFW22547.1 PE family protein [Mycobacterium tuberculosis variant bovis]SIT99847.1 pe family protein pe14 [Mycobacterium tuberculosis variant bovis AF2122/97]KFW43781.1 PE family protein [Mycobacterium tuberculosis variant bovis]KFW44357.1 PE family protein [Mycobacterium tuberculosis variant bovis]
MLASAATDLAGIGSALSAANAAAAAPTTAMLAACADEVSAVVASLFARHAQAYQALSLQATAFHQQFVPDRRWRGLCGCRSRQRCCGAERAARRAECDQRSHPGTVRSVTAPMADRAKTAGPGG